MKKSLLIGLAAATLAGITGANAQFTLGNLVVSRVGNGTDALANTWGSISLLEYTTAGSLVSTTTVSTYSSGTPSGLQWSGTATSEGAISLSSDGTFLTLVGYNPPFTGTGSIAGRSDAQAPRGYLTVDYNQNISAVTTIGAYSGNNIRSGVASADGTYFAGGTSGTIYRDSANTTIQSGKVNTRVANIANATLYISTGSAAGTPTGQGIMAFSGLPTSASTPTLIIATSDAYDFALNSSGDVMYIAKNTSATVGSIERWAFSGSSWSLTHTATGASGVTGLAVNFGSSFDTIYSVNPTTLQKIAWSSSGFDSSFTSLASAGSNYAFRGLEWTPVPEPSTYVAAAGLIGLMLWPARRRLTSLLARRA